MSVTNPERVVTKQDLADFYDELLPFISPKSYAGFTPIGTIIPMIAESAPANYLICNGATYNKSDYPELATHLLSMTSHSMYEVSGDSTKFKVPDLRGEFLRGTGTNAHTNQGNGANVGVHQDATESPNYTTTNAEDMAIIPVHNTGADSTKPKVINPDTTTSTSDRFGNINFTSKTNGTAITRYTSRPTNTSVLFCIAVKNIYLDPKNDYSTEEKVIGTWIDGKPIYQKTLELPTLDWGATVNVPHNISNLDKKVAIYGFMYDNGGALMPLPFIQDNQSTRAIKMAFTNTNVSLFARTTEPPSTTMTMIYGGQVTLQYTKTS